MIWLLITGLTGCLFDRELYERKRAQLADADGDGWSLAEGDCDDGDAARRPDPSAEIAYDGVDQDCDGADLVDVDGDGDAGTEADGGDCDDTDPERSSGREESWGDDGVDNDCDGETQDPLTWDAAGAVTRIDGPEAGIELGRRMTAWEEGTCLLITAPYADESRGTVFAEGAGPGIRVAGGNGFITGTEPYAFLTALDADEDGVLLLGSLTASEGRGRVWLADARVPCEGGDIELDDLDTVVTGDAAEDFLGAQGRWLPDVDGDGVRELMVSAPGHDGDGADAGAVAFFLGVGSDLGTVTFAAADIVVTGGHAGAAMEDVVYAQDGDNAWLLFSRANAGAGGVSLRRVPAGALASASVDDLADGGVATEGTWLSPTVAGDMDNDGGDEVVLGSRDWSIWELGELTGVVNESEASTWITAGETGEWITGVAAVGEVDAGSRADLLLLSDDWPSGSARGHVGLLSGEDLLWGQTTTLAGQRLQAVGAELGDAFGYRALPVGDFDGDGGVDLAISAYGADPAGGAAGAVYFLPLP